jgi:hypothetical protein
MSTMFCTPNCTMWNVDVLSNELCFYIPKMIVFARYSKQLFRRECQVHEWMIIEGLSFSFNRSEVYQRWGSNIGECLNYTKLRVCFAWLIAFLTVSLLLLPNLQFLETLLAWAPEVFTEGNYHGTLSFPTVVQIFDSLFVIVKVVS